MEAIKYYYNSSKLGIFIEVSAKFYRIVKIFFLRKKSVKIVIYIYDKKYRIVNFVVP